MKNLVLMHLESLNNLNYKMNAEKFSFLHEYEKKCISYAHYYSTATSTLMVLSDLQYGETDIFEACKSLDDVPNNLYDKESFFDELKREGYTTRVLVYPSSGDISGAEKRHFIGQTISAEEIYEYEKYIEEIDKTLLEDKFALHIVPTISNIAENKVVDVTKSKDCLFWDEGYEVLNNICKHIIFKLREVEKIKDTIIAFYGDHGDDYWGHGVHGGLAHAIEPNNLLISTPLFIWTGDEHFIQRNEVIQTSDLRKLISRKINGEDYVNERLYAFSRNEYANQDIRVKSFNKSYSIVDGRYMLLVSNNGLEMYDTVLDPSCMTNILSFFSLKNEVLRFDLNDVNDYKYHIKSFFGARQQRIIRMKFYELKRELINYVCSLYCDEQKALNEMSFDKIR